jgi:hypothetical protein
MRWKTPACDVAAFSIDFNFEECAGNFGVKGTMEGPLGRIDLAHISSKMIPNLRMILH